MISRHYHRAYDDTPRNYVLEIDGLVFTCPGKHGIYQVDADDGRPLPKCPKCGEQIAPLDATAQTSCYARHWIRLQDVARGLEIMRRRGT
jgi:hypothetical protein